MRGYGLYGKKKRSAEPTPEPEPEANPEPWVRYGGYGHGYGGYRLGYGGLYGGYRGVYGKREAEPGYGMGNYEHFRPTPPKPPTDYDNFVEYGNYGKREAEPEPWLTYGYRLGYGHGYSGYGGLYRGYGLGYGYGW